MMLAAPEFVIAERVELLDEIEVAAELQHRMLADRVVRGEESSEFKARHLFLSGGLLLLDRQATCWINPRQSRRRPAAFAAWRHACRRWIAWSEPSGITRCDRLPDGQITSDFPKLCQ